MSGDPDMRCTDEKLVKLCQEFHDHKLEEDVWRAEQDRRWKHLDESWLHLVEATTKSAECQRKNTEAIEKLVISIADMSDMARTYRDFQGVTRVGKGVQGLALWLLKWGLLGSAAAALIKWLIDYFSENPIT